MMSKIFSKKFEKNWISEKSWKIWRYALLQKWRVGASIQRISLKIQISFIYTSFPYFVYSILWFIWMYYYFNIYVVPYNSWFLEHENLFPFFRLNWHEKC